MSLMDAMVANVAITLPDGSVREFPAPVTGLEIASAIATSLAKAALAIKVNGELQDLTLPIATDAKVQIITGRDADGLEVIRHDTAHILAQAVKELYPDVQITIGPAIENGFYYDIARDHPFTPEDLVAIELRMQEIVQRDLAITRELWDRDKAIEFFKSIGEHYKAEIIGDIPAGEAISLYRQGDFLDLCRGPHAPTTGKPKAFKLMKLAGAYWRGDSRNPMLQRIYGTAWPDAKQLQAYLTQLEEAEKRDHRKLAKQLDLFHIEEASPGMIFWHEKGWAIYRALEQYIRQKLTFNGYGEVRTPILADLSLWEASGHWEKFRENMFTAESEDRIMALKPMNCPCHVQIFNQHTRSYRLAPVTAMNLLVRCMACCAYAGLRKMMPIYSAAKIKLMTKPSISAVYLKRSILTLASLIFRLNFPTVLRCAPAMTRCGTKLNPP